MTTNRLILLMHKIACKYITSSYITDFLMHDIKDLTQTDTPPEFIWQIRDTGTWLHRFTVYGWEEDALTKIKQYPENTHHYYHFNREKIRRITQEQALKIVEDSLASKQTKADNHET